MGIDVEDGRAASAVQLVIRWGRAPVGVHVVASGERFAVPPGCGGVEREPLVAPGGDGRPQLIAPAGAVVSRLSASGTGRTGYERVGRRARRAPLRVGDPEPIPITLSTVLRVELGALTVEVEGIAVARPAPLCRWWAGWLASSVPHVAASAACHAFLLGMLAWLAAPFATLRDSLSEEQRGLIQRYLRAAAESGAVVSIPSSPWGRRDAQGRQLASAQGGFWGAELGHSFGAGGLGLAGTGAGGGGRGRGIGLGGIGALGRLEGTGREAVLRRTSVRLGPTHSCGSVWLELPTKVEAAQEMKKRPEAELSCSSWSAEDPSKCTRWLVADHSRACSSSVMGRLPPEVIRAVLQRNHGRFRLCYQHGLQRNPSLRGRVVLQFTIAPRGDVTRATATGDLPDADVVSCMDRAVQGLQFPRSVSGSIAVTYPLVLRPAI